MLTLLAFLGEVDASLVACLDTLLALLIVPHSCHGTQLIEDFSTKSRHLLHVLKTVVHFSAEAWVRRQNFLGFRTAWRLLLDAESRVPIHTLL